MPSIKAAACLCLVSFASAGKAPGERQAALLQRQTADAGEASSIAIFAAGCFWGVELSFSRLPGVLHTEVGYAGGSTEQPTYRHVSGGRTGHAEAVRVLYDPAQISYADLLGVFFDVHDASQLNRQGNDVGTQYRSAIFYATEEERATAAAAIAAEGERTGRSIATVLEPATRFWQAEEYHQQVHDRETQGPVTSTHHGARTCSQPPPFPAPRTHTDGPALLLFVAQYLIKGGQSGVKGSLEPIRCYG
jgi:methionine-S-sulfoxide reductase